MRRTESLDDLKDFLLEDDRARQKWLVAKPIIFILSAVRMSAAAVISLPNFLAIVTDPIPRRLEDRFVAKQRAGGAL